MNPDGSGVRLVERPGWSPAWSPDGTRLAYIHKSSFHSCEYQLYIADADGSGKHSIFTWKQSELCDGARSASVAWSAGDLIAFTHSAAGPHGDDPELAAIRPDGSGLRRPFFSASAQQAGWTAGGRPDWSPDGSRLVFQVQKGLGTGVGAPADGLHVATAGGDVERRLTSSPLDALPSWSADGSTILFERDGGSWTVSPDGSQQSPFPLPVRFAEWSPSGGQVLSRDWASRPPYTMLTVRRVGGGEPSCVALVSAGELDYAWQPGSAPAAVPGRYCVPPGTSGSDRLVGGSDGDEMCGLAGEDTVNGLAGDDVLWGDACGDDGVPPTAATLSTRASDRLLGGVGADRLYGAGGKDRLEGGQGKDVLSGGPGKDKLFGGPGADKLAGGVQKNSITAGAGNDRIDARNGRSDHLVSCGPGRDTALVDRADNPRGCERVTVARR